MPKHITHSFISFRRTFSGQESLFSAIMNFNDDEDIVPTGMYHILEWYCPSYLCSCNEVKIDIYFLQEEHSDFVATLRYNFKEPTSPSNPILDPDDEQSEMADKMLLALKRSGYSSLVRKNNIFAERSQMMKDFFKGRQHPSQVLTQTTQGVVHVLPNSNDKSPENKYDEKSDNKILADQRDSLAQPPLQQEQSISTAKPGGIATSWQAKLTGLLRLFRFELPFTAGVCVILGEILALGSFPTLTQMILGFLSVFFISATSLILNDYFDLETDKINAPQRPLPAGLVSKRDVVILSVVVALLGFISAGLLSLTALGVVMVVWAVGFLYNWRFKKAGLVGNLMVAFSVGMTFIFGGIAVNLPYERIVWLFALWVLLIDLGEEIAADALDLEGDRLAGSRSLALVLGADTAIKISVAIFILVMVVSVLPVLLGWLDWVYLIPVLLMDSVILYSIRKLLDASISNRRPYIRWIYLSGLVALLLFIIIRMNVE